MTGITVELGKKERSEQKLQEKSSTCAIEQENKKEKNNTVPLESRDAFS